MKRIIAVEPGEWVILPCILETDDSYYRVDVYPDGRVEASDDERFAKEVAFYAERSDITEEVVRLRSHLEQFACLIASAGPAGQALDFLCLEMNREISTIGAKTADTATADSALAFKTELGRVREQIQNVV